MFIVCALRKAAASRREAERTAQEAERAAAVAEEVIFCLVFESVLSMRRH